MNNMLFQEQLESYDFKEGEVALLNAASFVDKNTIGELFVVRQSDDNVRVYSIYHAKGAEAPVVKYNKVMDRVGFEKFYFELSNMVEKVGHNVVEFNYRTRTIDSPHTSWYADEEYEKFTYYYLHRVLEGWSRSDIYEDMRSRVTNFNKVR